MKLKVELNKEKIKRYLNSMHEFNKVYDEVFEGKSSMTIQSAFSEGLARYVFGLSQYSKEDKVFDAEFKFDEKVLYFEIKATSTLNGSCNLNISSRPDFLIWMYFDITKMNIKISINKSIKTANKNEDLFIDSYIQNMDLKFQDRLNTIRSTRMSGIIWEKEIEYKFKNVSKNSYFISRK